LKKTFFRFLCLWSNPWGGCTHHRIRYPICLLLVHISGLADPELRLKDAGFEQFADCPIADASMKGQYAVND
jgi:hypothetical protein